MAQRSAQKQTTRERHGNFRQYVHVVDGRPVLIFPDSGDALIAYLATPRIPLLDIFDIDGNLCEDDGVVHDEGPMTSAERAELAIEVAADLASRTGAAWTLDERAELEARIAARV